jgi:hypothetical protein
MSSIEGEETPHAHPDEGGKGLSATKTAELKQADGSLPSPAKARRKRSAGSPDDVSRALRSAYDDALREQVPDDFLDLLGKLS